VVVRARNSLKDFRDVKVMLTGLAQKLKADSRALKGLPSKISNVFGYL
jgi:hypothetical protein